jgi:hypothetical protein
VPLETRVHDAVIKMVVSTRNGLVWFEYLTEKTEALRFERASNSCVVFRLLEKSFRKSYPKTAKKI